MKTWKQHWTHRTDCPSWRLSNTQLTEHILPQKSHLTWYTHPTLTTSPETERPHNGPYTLLLLNMPHPALNTASKTSRSRPSLNTLLSTQPLKLQWTWSTKTDKPYLHPPLYVFTWQWACRLSFQVPSPHWTPTNKMRQCYNVVYTLLPLWTPSHHGEHVQPRLSTFPIHTFARYWILSARNQHCLPKINCLAHHWKLSPQTGFHHTIVNSHSQAWENSQWTEHIFSTVNTLKSQRTFSILAQCQALSSETEKLPKGLATLRWQWTLTFHNESNSHLKENLLACFHWLW